MRKRINGALWSARVFMWAMFGTLIEWTRTAQEKAQDEAELTDFGSVPPMDEESQHKARQVRNERNAKAREVREAQKLESVRTAAKSWQCWANTRRSFPGCTERSDGVAEGFETASRDVLSLLDEPTAAAVDLSTAANVHRVRAQLGAMTDEQLADVARSLEHYEARDAVSGAQRT